ncbi:MAG TPA: hypothetical protein VGJ04_09965 [Pirellulales bacterium]|jgi:ABC-type uncharacterized transport system permease subunit
MAKSKAPINLFYGLCVVAGVAFTITACAYGVLMVRVNRGLDLSTAAPEEHPLMSLLDRYGMIILGVEVAVLVAVSVAAIMLDHYRGKRETTTRKP